MLTWKQYRHICRLLASYGLMHDLDDPEYLRLRECYMVARERYNATMTFGY